MVIAYLTFWAFLEADVKTVIFLPCLSLHLIGTDDLSMFVSVHHMKKINFTLMVTGVGTNPNRVGAEIFNFFLLKDKYVPLIFLVIIPRGNKDFKTVSHAIVQDTIWL